MTNQDHEANSPAHGGRLADEGVEVREWQIDPQQQACLTWPSGLENAAGRTRAAGLFSALLERGWRNQPGCRRFTAAVACGWRLCLRGWCQLCPAWIPVNVGDTGPRHLPFLGLQDLWTASGVDGQPSRALGKCFCQIRPIISTPTSLYKRFTPAGPDHAQIAASCRNGRLLWMRWRRITAFTAKAAERTRGVHDLMRAHETRIAATAAGLPRSRTATRSAPDWPAMTREAKGADGGPRSWAVPGRTRCGREACGARGSWPVRRRLSMRSRALEAMGIAPDKGVLRLSFTHYTSPEEAGQSIS